MKKLLFFAVAIFIAQFSQAQWEPDVRLTDNADSSLTYWGMTHSIAVSGDTVHVVWYDKSDGNWEIYYMRSTDEGVSWETATRLTNDPAKSTSASISVSGSVVHVVWCDSKTGNSEIYYRRSTDGGTNWEEEMRLTNDLFNSYGPSVSASGSNVHVVWVDYDYDLGIWMIHYNNSTDEGISWEEEKWLSDNSYNAYNPSIASTGTDILCVWNDRRDGNLEIYSKHSADEGLSWEQDVRLTNNPVPSQLPSISMSGPFVHIVWCELREGIGEIFYKQSVDGGLSWSEDTRIANTDSWSPNISLSGPLVSVVWEDYQKGFPEIFYKCSVDGGITWDTDILLNDVSFCSQRPFIAVSNQILHVIWHDLRDSNFEIYYKRNPTGGCILTTDFTANTTTPCPGDTVQFTNLTSCYPTQWLWTFQGGTPGTSNQQGPQIVYNSLGSYDVTLFASNSSSDDQITKTAYITVLPLSPPVPESPIGQEELCQNPSNSEYATSGSPEANGYTWQIIPADAGVFNGFGTMITVNWTNDFTGDASISVQAFNECGESAFSTPLIVTISPLPTAYAVTGGGPYCFGTSGSTIELSGSQTNHTYELYLDDQPTGITMQGNGSMISFPNITSPGTYTIMATENSTLCSGMMEGAVMVYVIYIPEIPPVPLGPDYVDLFYNTETEYTTEGSLSSASYEWSLFPSDAGTISILDTTTALVTWNSNFLGIVNLSVRGVNECGQSVWSEALAITVDNTIGLSDAENSISVRISPNPNNGIFRLSLHNKKEEILTLRVFNTLGEAIFEERNVTLRGHDNKRIELTGAPNGIYFLQIGNESAVFMHKIIIQKN
ncbi:MAG: T9SS type A sorting domain-containing protein [Bacteroidetes bacterium]|nr:T9SS type A sorting domain-containing protein [Bacteroidota bacterium]